MPPRSLSEADRIRLVRAFGFATSWHRLDAAPGDDAPLLAHLLRVTAAALERGPSPDEAIASLVHRGPGEAPSAELRLHRERTIADLLGESVLGRVQRLAREHEARARVADG